MTSLVDSLLAAGVPVRDGGQEASCTSWKGVVERSLLRFDFDFKHPRAFRGMVRDRPLAGVNFISMACDQHAAYRGQERITAADEGYYLMTLQTSGELRLTQDFRTAALKPGLFAIYDSSKPATLISSNDYKSVCIKFPKEKVGAGRADSLAEITATAFECDKGMAAAVWSTLLNLNQSMDSLGCNGYLAVHGLMDLVTVMLRTQLGQRDLETAEPHLALLRTIREHIDDNLSDPNLSPHTIAAAHYISPRYLHSLFRRTDVTVAAWIRTRRMELCRRDLADPRLATVPVASIAARRGFGGASHFGQMFKQATGATPAEFRRGALAQLAQLHEA